MSYFVEKVLSKLTNQFYDKKRIADLIEIFCSFLDDILARAEDIRTKRFIDYATGNFLDRIGEVVGEERKGRTDEEYKIAILIRIFINTSKGTPENIITALRFITKPTDCQYMEAYPATTLLFTDGLSVPKNIQEIIQDLAPIAISVIPVMVSYGNTPLRCGMTKLNSELKVTIPEKYIFQAQESNLELNQSIAGDSESGLGGLNYPTLEVNGNVLLVNNCDVLVYTTNKLSFIGEYTLPGVYQ